MRGGRAFLGMAIVLVGLLATTWAMYRVMHTGTCASGGAYVIAHQCPAGTGLQILALMGGIVLGLIGAAVAGSGALGAMWFGLFFTLSGIDAMVALGGTGGVVFGLFFVVLLGLPGIGFSIYQADEG
jgi:hypothetical protein